MKKMKLKKFLKKPLRYPISQYIRTEKLLDKVLKMIFWH